MLFTATFDRKRPRDFHAKLFRRMQRKAWVAQEFAGVVLALPDTLALVAVPAARLLHDAMGGTEVDDFTFVQTMAERKAGLLAHTEGLIALPGGCGTLEELAEAITLKRLGQYLKPVVIVNQNGFYDDLLRQLQRMVDEEFMNPEHLGLWTVVDHPRDAVSAIVQTPDLSPDILFRAAVKA